MPDARDDQTPSLRRRVIERRGALTEADLHRAGEAMTAALAATPEFQNAKRLSVYWPVRGEMDVRPVIDTALAQGKRVHLPVLAPPERETGLLFAPYTHDTPMVRDRYGIPEPDVAPDELIDAAGLDLAVVPLVLFDDAGHRVGMGGGYYDRAFGFTRETAMHQRPTLVGTAHEFQRTESLEPQPWDVAMDLIVTDAGVRRPDFAHR